MHSETQTDTRRTQDTGRTPRLPPCPQCEHDDLRPYGNGSKWICPSCKFLAPCCEPDTACLW